MNAELILPTGPWALVLGAVAVLLVQKFFRRPPPAGIAAFGTPPPATPTDAEKVAAALNAVAQHRDALAAKYNRELATLSAVTPLAGVASVR